ncbi:hypothetical protein BGZ63DRAFT_395955 [Mariannaea sp. PMI_226]|nr:hypothetical protein BGZ63DRAFT_395955 [Mariannaea sp. PMI_226]
MAEQIIPSNGLLHDALLILGSSDVVEHAQTKTLILSKFPKKNQLETWEGGERNWTSFEQNFVTGLSGKATVAATGSYPHGKGRQQFSIKPGDRWELRWDYDTAKGSHVNVKVGENKFAPIYPEGSIKRNPNTAPGTYFDAIRDQTSFVGYNKGMSQEDLDYCAKMLSEYYCSKFSN